MSLRKVGVRIGALVLGPSARGLATFTIIMVDAGRAEPEVVRHSPLPDFSTLRPRRLRA
jgi:hypothetical protein